MYKKKEVDLDNLCNEAWAQYSNGTPGLVSMIAIEKIRLGSTLGSTLSIEDVTVPLLFCQNKIISNFAFSILTLYDDEIPSEEMHFIFGCIRTSKYGYGFTGYMYKVYQNQNDGNINRN